MLDKGWWDTAMPQCFIRLMPAEKGFIVEMMRAKQSATSLFGAHANAGVWPKNMAQLMCANIYKNISNTSIMQGWVILMHFNNWQKTI